VNSGFLPVPELRRTTPEAPQQVAASPEAAPGADAATLEERMLAGSAAFDAPVANSYASASTEEEGLTGMVLRLIKKNPEDDTN
jgi:hypothetical protein